MFCYVCPIPIPCLIFMYIVYTHYVLPLTHKSIFNLIIYMTLNGNTVASDVMAYREEYYLTVGTYIHLK